MSHPGAIAKRKRLRRARLRRAKRLAPARNVARMVRFVAKVLGVRSEFLLEEFAYGCRERERRTESSRTWGRSALPAIAGALDAMRPVLAGEATS